MNNKNKSLKQIIDFRKQKLNELINSKIDPFPSNYKKSHSIEDVISNEDDFLNKKISIAGRIISLRNMGKVSFVNIQDNNTKIQLFIKKDNLKEDIYTNVVKKIDIGDIVGCKGELFYTKTKELSIRVKSFTLLAKSIRPLPNLKEKDGKVFFSFDDKETRYRKRYLDLIANPQVKDIFINRAKIINSLREFLNNDDYVEVETPILQPIYGGANAKPFKTFHNSLDQQFYLRIADELYLKRLIIGGFEKVYEISKNFRNEGMDKDHNPEFTMLEYYASYSDVYKMMDFTEKLIKNVYNEVFSKQNILFKNKKINIKNKFYKADFYTIIKDKVNIDIQKLSDDELKQFLKKKNILVNKEFNRGNMIDKIFSTFVEPHLIEPTFIYNYPLILSPLAKKNIKNDTLVDRFELFMGGMEIANAFSELNDPVDQRQRLENQNKLRELGDNEAQVLDNDFIEAMEYGMPPTGGVGLGIDRLTMIFTLSASG